MYRKRSKNNPRTLTAIRLRPSTLEGLNKLRASFHQRWPEAQYPTLSFVLEEILVRNIDRLEDPEVMAIEVEDFRLRYDKSVHHKPATTDEATQS